MIGARYRDLARFNGKHARTAQDYIGRALTLRHPSRARNRAFDLIGEALPLAGSWVSGRVGAKLRDFHAESGPFATVPAMREAREAVATLTTA